MKNKALIILMLILTSVSSYSQIPIQKTKVNGQNAVIISDAVMDSIMSTYYGLEKCKAQLLLASIEKATLNLQVDFLTSDNENLQQQVNNLKMQLQVTKQIHTVDLGIEKAKNNGKFKSFLYGTAAGALIITVLISAI